MFFQSGSLIVSSYLSLRFLAGRKPHVSKSKQQGTITEPGSLFPQLDSSPADTGSMIIYDAAPGGGRRGQITTFCYSSPSLDQLYMFTGGSQVAGMAGMGRGGLGRRRLAGPGLTAGGTASSQRAMQPESHAAWASFLATKQTPALWQRCHKSKMGEEGGESLPRGLSQVEPHRA